MINSLPVAAFGYSGSSTVNLLDLLKEAYGDQVSSIAAIQIAYRNEAWLNSATPAPFSYWDPGLPVVTSIMNVPPNGTDLTDWEGIANSHFKDVTIAVGNNIAPNVYLQIQLAGDGTAAGITYQQLSVQTLPEHFASPAAYDGAPTPDRVVAMAEQFADYYDGFPNATDCHWIAMAIAAAAGATLSPQTQTDDGAGHQTPAKNEEGGFWRIVYRGSDPNPTSDWDNLVQPGDIVRMEWKSGGQHTTTVIAGLNADGQHSGMIEVVDNGVPTLSGLSTMIGAHWVDYDADTVATATTIYRLSPDQKYLIGGSPNSDKIIGTVWNDEIRGGDGNDTISGGLGVDILHGGAGNDVLEGGPGADVLDGGEGTDTAYYKGATAAVVADLPKLRPQPG